MKNRQPYFIDPFIYYYYNPLLFVDNEYLNFIVDIGKTIFIFNLVLLCPPKSTRLEPRREARFQLFLSTLRSFGSCPQRGILS